MENLKPCPLCDSTDLKLSHRTRYRIGVIKCRHCGCAFRFKDNGTRHITGSYLKAAVVAEWNSHRSRSPKVLAIIRQILARKWNLEEQENEND